MMRLRTLAPLVRSLDGRTVTLPPKQVDPAYRTDAYRAWRAEVVRRAGAQCEAIDHGQRCDRAWPAHRLYADHIRELRDGGSLLDLNNGQCLCASHHKMKTDQARARRARE